MSQPSLPLRGAIDLSRLGSPSAPGAAGTTANQGASSHGTQSQDVPNQNTGGQPGTIDVTELNFQSFAEQSLHRPVLLLLCSTLAPGCADLRSRLEAIIAKHGGRLVLGVADVDAQPGIAQAFQVQAVPAVVAMIGGRPAPLFQGSPSDEQLVDVIDQVLKIAADAGVGSAPADGEGEPTEAPEPPPLPPLHQEAFDAIERGDLPAALAAYDKALVQNPRDADARAGRAQVGLLQRTSNLDSAEARSRAADKPSDVEAQLDVADLDVLAGAVEDAFSRLLDAVMAASPEDRDRLRVRLVELFDVVGGDDPRVVAARKRLASVLY